jgi:hypothetical protein
MKLQTPNAAQLRASFRYIEPTQSVSDIQRPDIPTNIIVADEDFDSLGIPVEEEQSQEESTGPKILTLAELIEANPTMRPEVVSGLIRKGEVCNIIAAPKLGKSFLAANLAFAVANGMHWLSYPTIAGRVLIIDNELHSETLASRLNVIGKELMVSIDNIDVLPLRGENQSVTQLELLDLGIDAGKYQLVVLDALYRALPEETSENDNAAMARVFNALDRLAKKWDAAIAVVHHVSKGDQQDKSITDVGSGAGSMSRAADTHLIIRPHQSDGFAVMEAVTRSFRSPEPITIQFDYPVWTAKALTPQLAARTSATAASQKQNDDAVLKAMCQSGEPGELKWWSIAELRGKPGVSDAAATVKGSLNRLLKIGAIEATERESKTRGKNERNTVAVYRVLNVQGECTE